MGSGARALRLSLPEEALTSALAKRSSSGSSDCDASHTSSGEAGRGGSGAGALPAALSAQPGLPEAHPLPQRRVRFDYSPVKSTHRYEVQEEEVEEAAPEQAAAGAAVTQAAAAAAAALTRCRAAAAAAPSNASSSSSLSSGCPSPQRSALSAELAAWQRLPGSGAAGMLGGGGGLPSPTRAAALAAVPMADLLHSVASLSRAGKEPTYRKQNQDNCFAFSQVDRGGPAAPAAPALAAGILPACRIFAGGCRECMGWESLGWRCASWQLREAAGRTHGRLAHFCADSMFPPRAAPCPQPLQYCRPNQALLAALDGHGPNGHLVSAFLKRQLPLLLADRLGESGAAAAAARAARDASFTSASSAASTAASCCSTAGSGVGADSGGCGAGAAGAAGADPAAALAATFLAADAALGREPGVNVQYSGSTAVLCMLRGRRLTTAWVGDSRAVLARQVGAARGRGGGANPKPQNDRRRSLRGLHPAQTAVHGRPST